MSVPRSMARKRRLTRAQLEQNLEILKAVIALPTFLPAPSPPSRSASPAPSLSGRRKLPTQAVDSSEQQPPAKRQRTSLQQTDVHQPSSDSRSPHIPPQSIPIHKEEATPLPSTSTSVAPSLPPPPQVLATAPTPGAAPETSSFSHRRGKPSAAEFARFCDRYMSYGKLLKASAEERMRVVSESEKSRTNPAQLPHLSLISRVEAVDGLLNFTYSIWCKDMEEGRCRQSLWDSLDPYLQWVRSKWESAETRGDAQRAFLGLIRMIEGYVYARKCGGTQFILSKKTGEIERANKPPQAPDPTPAVSPATSLGGSSQHSAPNNSPALVNPTPPALASSRTAPSHAAPNAPSSSSTQTMIIPKDYYDAVQTLLTYHQRSARNVSIASVYFNLPVIARCFPKTYARILSCQLRYDEEYEVDFDQDECSRPDGASNLDYTPSPGEGPLMWPSPLVTQGTDGLVWVLLLGRAMIREVAFASGYRGMAGLYRKETAR